MPDSTFLDSTELVLNMGPAAPLHARGAARHPQAGWRKGPGHGLRHRLPAPRRGEDRREPHLRAVQSVRGPHGLRGGHFQRPGLLPGGGEAAERGSAAARAGRPRHPHGAEPHRQPPAVAGHARPRYRRHHAGVLLPPRARGSPQDLREVLRRAAHHARLPHRRPAIRDLRRLRAGGAGLLRHVPAQGGRVRGTAHQQPHLGGPAARTWAS